MSSTTINISMPEAMRQFVEAQAAAQNYSTSEYMRHLVRKEQHHLRALWGQLLAISEAQITRGDVSHITVDELIARSEAKGAPARKPRRKKP